ncbi:MAG: DinB family protein [Candidatus Thorarchaeota archaeon]
MNLKQFAIDTLDIAEWNVLRAIMRLKPADFEYQITPDINPIRWIIGHLAWHMDYLFNYLCQGKWMLRKELRDYFVSGSELVGKREFPASVGELVDSFLEISQSSFAYLNLLPEERFNELPENNTGRNTETVAELIQRIALHLLGHTGQIYLVKKELGKGGYFVTGVKKKQREDSRRKWMKWWSENNHHYE